MTTGFYNFWKMENGIVVDPEWWWEDVAEIISGKDKVFLVKKPPHLKNEIWPASGMQVFIKGYV